MAVSDSLSPVSGKLFWSSLTAESFLSAVWLLAMFCTGCSVFSRTGTSWFPTVAGAALSSGNLLSWVVPVFTSSLKSGFSSTGATWLTTVDCFPLYSEISLTAP